VMPLLPFTVHGEVLARAPWATWARLGYLGVITSVISYLLWYFALSRLEASRVAVFSNLQPVFTAVAALVLLQEPIHWELVVGGALVLAGVRLPLRS
jgi:drug/metabolite transporter (DMT)-like permease